MVSFIILRRDEKHIAFPCLRIRHYGVQGKYTIRHEGILNSFLCARVFPRLPYGTCTRKLRRGAAWVVADRVAICIGVLSQRQGGDQAAQP